MSGLIVTMNLHNNHDKHGVSDVPHFDLVVLLLGVTLLIRPSNNLIFMSRSWSKQLYLTASLSPYSVYLYCPHRVLNIVVHSESSVQPKDNIVGRESYGFTRLGRLLLWMRHILSVLNYDRDTFGGSKCVVEVEGWTVYAHIIAVAIRKSQRTHSPCALNDFI